MEKITNQVQMIDLQLWKDNFILITRMKCVYNNIKNSQQKFVYCNSNYWNY